MPETWKELFISGPEVPLQQLVIRLLLAFALGCVISGIYLVTRRKTGRTTPSFASTLVLLTILIAIVSQVIGNNIALAFSLVGALSIVRFRALVDDTRDLAFVIFSAVTGMAVGIGHAEVAIVGVIITGLATAIVRPRSTPFSGERWTLSLRVPAAQSADEPLQPVFGKHLQSSRLMATSTARQGSALELTYQIIFKPGSAAIDLTTELNLLAGLQDIELRRA